MVVSDEVLPVGDGVLGFEQWLGDGSFSVRSASLSGRVFSRQWGLEKLSVDSRGFESGSGVASSWLVDLCLWLLVVCGLVFSCSISFRIDECICGWSVRLMLV